MSTSAYSLPARPSPSVEVSGVFGGSDLLSVPTFLEALKQRVKAHEEAKTDQEKQQAIDDLMDQEAVSLLVVPRASVGCMQLFPVPLQPSSPKRLAARYSFLPSHAHSPKVPTFDLVRSPLHDVLAADHHAFSSLKLCTSTIHVPKNNLMTVDGQLGPARYFCLPLEGPSESWTPAERASTDPFLRLAHLLRASSPQYFELYAKNLVLRPTVILPAPETRYEYLVEFSYVAGAFSTRCRLCEAEDLLLL
ncbi:hypothetical protein JCM1841_002967 [Sporobolomyces salmonicolor]